METIEETNQVYHKIPGHLSAGMTGDLLQSHQNVNVDTRAKADPSDQPTLEKQTKFKKAKNKKPDSSLNKIQKN